MELLTKYNVHILPLPSCQYKYAVGQGAVAITCKSGINCLKIMLRNI